MLKKNFELAKAVIVFLHGEESYQKALHLSECLFSDKIYELSSSDILSSFKGVPTVEIANEGENIIDFLVNKKINTSKREAREFVLAGAISINNEKIIDLEYKISKNKAIDNKVLVINKGKKKKYLAIFK